MRNRSNRENLWDAFTGNVDNYLTPVAFAVLSFLCITQMAAHFPPVRQYIDTVENRFTREPAVAATASTVSEKAWIDLYASPAHSASGIEVFCNQKPIGSFKNAHLRLRVSSGDIIGFKSPSGGPIYISVDQNNADLLLPAPGYQVELTSQDPEATLPAATFLQ